MTSPVVSLQHLASPLHAFFVTVPALLIVVACFRLAGATSLDASSIAGALRDTDWRALVIACAWANRFVT